MTKESEGGEEFPSRGIRSGSDAGRDEWNFRWMNASAALHGFPQGAASQYGSSIFLDPGIRPPPIPGHKWGLAGNYLDIRSKGRVNRVLLPPLLTIDVVLDTTRYTCFPSAQIP